MTLDDIEDLNCRPCRHCGHPEFCHVCGCAYGRRLPVCANYEPTNEEAEQARGAHRAKPVKGDL